MFERHLIHETLQVYLFLEAGAFFVHDSVDDSTRNRHTVSRAERRLCAADLVSSTSWNRFFLKSDREVVGKSRAVGGTCVGPRRASGIGG